MRRWHVATGSAPWREQWAFGALDRHLFYVNVRRWGKGLSLPETNRGINYLYINKNTCNFKNIQLYICIPSTLNPSVFNGWMEMVETTPHFHMAMIFFFVLPLIGNQFNEFVDVSGSDRKI